MKSNIPIPGSAREKILQEAIKAFGTQGYEKVNVQHLAKTTGVTTGALYHHFGNKLELYKVVREEIERRITSRMEAAAEVHEDSLSSLKSSMIIGFNAAVKLNVYTLLSEPDVSLNQDLIAVLFNEIMNEDTPGVEVLLSSLLRAALKNVSNGMSPEDAKQALIWFIEKI
ncbi:TetR/AcrR family transcriptional regulator [Fictibacillus phosphorivorans]|uniref:TetR/AcrR family transcriptional regulator n=1 Tax=Fictibacillus phosphorivorans TaxID=1221500 RepID=UPI0011A8A417|nr:TetR/AcrR family transcriptional regulator [Fictibacillus phosphorivorans]